MQYKKLIAVTMIASLVLGAVPVLAQNTNAGRKEMATQIKQCKKDALAAYNNSLKDARDAYLSALKTAKDNYMSAIDNAKSTYASELAVAKTGEKPHHHHAQGGCGCA